MQLCARLVCRPRLFYLAVSYLTRVGKEGSEESILARSICAFIVAALAVFATPAPNSSAEFPCPSVLDHKFANLMDEPVSLCQFRGKVLLIVNTASECGYTPQYEGLEKLYRRYRDKGFAVLGFPANDFGGQEPGSNKEIAHFCQVSYGITFPVFAKTSVVGGNANPLFRELAARTGKPPRWNFHKYLIDRAGQPVAVFESAVEPEDPRVTSQIEKLLAAR
jgi:glutathione peroxidase